MARRIQDIKINHVRPARPARVERVERDVPSEPAREESRERRVGGQPRYTLWFVAAISIVFLLFALSYLFTEASVVVYPKVEEVALNENLSATSLPGGGELSYELIVLEGEESRTVKASGEEDISERARGTALIYNAYGQAPQNLTIDTRLEGSNGKIYKTLTKTVVPGMKSDGTPGSVEVSIYASEPGEEYNSPPLDFKIFGFKGTPKYEKFYARSKGSLVGGALGRFPAVSSADRASLERELKQSLETKLIKKAADQIPAGFVLYQDAVLLKAEGLDSQPAEGGNVTFKQMGTLYAILFEEDSLEAKVIAAVGPEVSARDVYVANIRDLNFSLAGAEAFLADPNGAARIDFNLSGSAKITYRVDTEKLLAELLGKKKKDFNLILREYENIASADLSLSPIWKRTLPEQPSDIEIRVEN